jgi:hypothetical protein
MVSKQASRIDSVLPSFDVSASTGKSRARSPDTKKSGLPLIRFPLAILNLSSLAHSTAPTSAAWLVWGVVIEERRAAHILHIQCSFTEVLLIPTGDKFLDALHKKVSRWGRLFCRGL